jgi:tellurite resistance protein TerC
MSENFILWAAFSVFVLGMLALDLGVFHRKNKEIKVKEAFIWTGIWIGIAMLFNVFVFFYFGKVKALDFLTGYLIEKSLSIDNIFVILMIFSYFSVPAEYQHKVLFWGILGALLMRLVFILLGIELIQRFHWVIYVFGGFLLVTGFRMFFTSNSAIKPDKNPVVRLARKIFPFTPGFEGGKFFVRQNSKLFATNLFLVVLLIEATDLIFAVDSIPAILAISDDPFIVYTSNVFAILGLRSLYFALAGLEKYFRYLKYGLAAILIFVGAKMCLSEVYKVNSFWSLIIIAFLLAVSMIASIVAEKKSHSKT